MAKQILRRLIEKGTIEHLEALLEVKTKIHSLQGRRTELAKELDEIDRELDQIYEKLPDLGFELVVQRRKDTSASEGDKKDGRKRTGLKAELVVEVMQEAGEPMSVEELAGALISKKDIPDTGKKLRSNLRVMLYQNRKGLFAKAGKGVFTLGETPEGGGGDEAPADPAGAEGN